MADPETLVTGPDDMHRIAGYADLEAFADHVQNQTDLEVELFVEDEYVLVMHESGGSQSRQMTFEYPFDAEDIAHWVYHFENDNSLRYEILEDVEKMLDLPVYADDTEDEEYERTERVREFVTGLLWERWIDLDGSDLLIMDPDGGPLELTCSHQWLTYCLGSVIVDLTIADEPLSLYDTAYGAFWSKFGEQTAVSTGQVFPHHAGRLVVLHCADPRSSPSALWRGRSCGTGGLGGSAGPAARRGGALS